jgi:phosphatidylglycerol:prolipoprotein diacylglycerol transferase
MYPELFEIPFIHVTIKSYGLMMVIGFLAAVTIIRRLSRNITPDSRLITNAALYSLIAGIVGARLFYVIHYYNHFRENPFSTFFVWQGGLELIGGVILSITIIFLYLLYHKLPVRQYLDILAIGLMLALVFGRIGCFLNGCCFGEPTKLPWGIRFPYNSFAYISQINANPQRNRPEPQLNLPRQDYQSYTDADGRWYPKPLNDLTEEQKKEVTKGKYRCLPVHPTQLYSSLKAAILCIVLYLFWRRSQQAGKSKTNKLFTKSGYTFGLMFILYGIARFFMEYLRDDNPFEHDWWAIYKGGTISQNLGIYMTIFGIVLLMIFQVMKSKPRNS